MLKKNFTTRQNHPPPPPPQKSNGRPLTGDTILFKLNCKQIKNVCLKECSIVLITARVIVRLVSGCSVPAFQSFSDTVITCVNDRGVIKVNAMIIRPRMVRNVRAFGTRFHISGMLFFSSDERSAGFTYVIPQTGGATNFTYNIALFFFGRAKL